MLASLAMLSAQPRAAAAQGAPPRAAGSDGAVTIGTRDSLQSRTLQETRRYLVYLPPSYRDTTYSPRRYPVLYLLDGDAHFHSVTGLIQILGTGVNGTFVVPEMIVVAISNTDRTRDMTPTRVETGFDGKPSPAFRTSGGMDRFLSFIKDELIPRIDAQYRTAPYRVLVGHSLGGITAIHALYTIPETFGAYVAIDPSLWWDNTLLLRQARAKIERPGAFANRALFVAQANTINPADSSLNTHFNAIAQFDGVVRAYNQSGLRYGFRYYPDDSHGSVPLIAEYDALRFIFGGYDLNMLRVLERPTLLREHFARISRELGYDHPPPEGMVELLAQVAMQQDRGKSLAFRALNAELYPSSARAHESLAGAYLAQGDTTRALASIRTTLSLAPNRRWAKETLSRLTGGR
jgi:predicted alpha/beta superfamily hydrolase